MDPFYAPPTTRAPGAGPATARVAPWTVDAARRALDLQLPSQQTPQGQFMPPPMTTRGVDHHPPLANQGVFERARPSFGQHQAAFQHTQQMQPFQQPNMPQHPYVMHDPPAMPMAMAGPGINWPGPMHPQQPTHQQPPRGFAPGYGQMQQMAMGVVGPNVEYNQTHAPLMPPPSQSMHAPNQADRQYHQWHALPVEDGFANNPFRLMQHQSGMQVNQVPAPGGVPPYQPPPAAPSRAPWDRAPWVQDRAAQVYPGQNFPPVPQLAAQDGIGLVPPLNPGLPLPGHRHSHPGALLSYHNYPAPPMHALWRQMPNPKLKDFGAPSPAAHTLHRLNPAVPLAYACRFVHMFNDRFANKFELNMFSGWCQRFEKSTFTPQQLFDHVDNILALNGAWDLKDMFSLFRPVSPSAVVYPLFFQPSGYGGNYQGGNNQRAYGQGVYKQHANARAPNAQAANAQAPNAQAANDQAANARDVDTQTSNSQAADHQGANDSNSSQPGNDRVVDQAEPEGNDAREAIRRHTKELEHNEGQETRRNRLVVKLPVVSPNSTASPRGKKRAAKSDDGEHENAEGSDSPDFNAVNKPMTKKQKKKKGRISGLKASDSTEQESPDQRVQYEIGFTGTLHLSGSPASHDSDSPTPHRFKQSRRKGIQKKTAVAPARKHVKPGNKPATQVPHVGPVFPSRRAVFARDSRPYIHSICGRGFKHMDDVKSHHYGNASKKVGCPVIRAAVAERGRKVIDDFPAWDAHESCKIRYTDIKYLETKNGYVILNQESLDKVQKAIDAGEEYKRMMNEDGDDDDAMQDQDDIVTEIDEDLVNEDVKEESQDDDTKNIDPFLLSSKAELGWTFPATRAYAPQPFGYNALVSNTSEQMSKGPMKADSSVTGAAMQQRAAKPIPIMDQPPAHLKYMANASFHGPNIMGQLSNYQMPDITQPNPTLSPTTPPTKPNVPKRKVVKAGWNAEDEHDEEKLRAAALEWKMRNKK